MAVNKEELNKLSLRERIRRLKQLEEDRKKEIEEIDDLIKDSQRDLRSEEVAEEVSPETEDVDISKLFRADEEELERTVREGAPAAEETEEGGARYLSLQQAVEDYEELKGMNYASMDGSLNESQMENIDKIGERLDTTKYVSQSKEVVNLLVASKAALYKIKKYAGLDNENF